jgi:hypothetical protein
MKNEKNERFRLVPPALYLSDKNWREVEGDLIYFAV